MCVYIREYMCAYIYNIVCVCCVLCVCIYVVLYSFVLCMFLMGTNVCSICLIMWFVSGCAVLSDKIFFYFFYASVKDEFLSRKSEQIKSNQTGKENK